MASSELEVSNLALSRIGENPISAMSDTSRNAKIVARHFDEIRDQVLILYPWTTAIDRAELEAVSEEKAGTLVSGDATVTVASTTGLKAGSTVEGTGIPDDTTIESITDATHFELSAAATASGSVTLTIVRPNNSPFEYQYELPTDCLRALDINNDVTIKFGIEGRTLYTDEEDCILRYIKREEDPSIWGPLLTDAIALKLAAIVAQITGRTDWYKACAAEFETMLQLAWKTDGLQHTAQTEEPGWWFES